jgi:hypothetical protein
MAGTSVTAEGSEQATYISPTTVSAGYLVEQTGQNLYRRLHALSLPLIKEHRDGSGQRHALSFVASELVAWLLKERDFSNQHDAVAFLHALLQTGVLIPVGDSSMTFSDSQQLYRFKSDTAVATATPSRRTRRNSSRMKTVSTFGDSEDSLLGDSGAPGSSSSMEGNSAAAGSISPVTSRHSKARASWNGEELGFSDEDLGAAAGSASQGDASAGITSVLLSDPAVMDALSGQNAAALRSRLAALDASAGPRDLALLVLAALQYNALDCAKVVLEAGSVDINATLNASGDTVLHRAALLNDRRTVAFLLEHGADVNRVNAVGSPPLTLAVTREENHECAIRLLEHGARIRIVNRDGKRPIDYMPVLAETQRLLCAGIGDDLAKGRDPLATLRQLTRLAINPETLGLLCDQLCRKEVITMLCEVCAASGEASAYLSHYMAIITGSAGAAGDRLAARASASSSGSSLLELPSGPLDPDVLSVLLALVRVPGQVQLHALSLLSSAVGGPVSGDDDQLPQLARMDLQPVADALAAPAEEEEIASNIEALHYAALILGYATRLPRVRAALATDALVRRLVQRVLQLAAVPAAGMPHPLGSTLANVVRLLGNLCCEVQHERQFRSIGTVSAMRALLHNRDPEVRQLSARTLIIVGEQEVGGIDLFTPASQEMPNLDTAGDVLYHRSPYGAGTKASMDGSSATLSGGVQSTKSPVETSGERTPRTRASSPLSSAPSSAGTAPRVPMDAKGCPAVWTALKGASLERAIQILTEPSSNNVAGLPFIMYQPYWPARVAFRLLHHRFRNTVMHSAMSELPPEHAVILRVLRIWIKQALDDFATDAVLLKELKLFLEQMQSVGGEYAVAADGLLRQQIVNTPQGKGSGRGEPSGHLSYAHSLHEELYPAAKQAVLNGDVPLTTEMAVALAAAQTRIDDLARRAANPHAAQALLKHAMPPVKLRNILPASFARSKDAKQLLASVQSEYDKIKHRSDRDCKHLYLGIYHLVANHECIYFSMKQVVGDGKRKVARIVGVSPLRFLIVDDKSKKLLMSFSLVELRGWKQIQMKDRTKGSFKLQTGSGKMHGLVLTFAKEEAIFTADEASLTSLSNTMMMRIKQHPRFLAAQNTGNAKAGTTPREGPPASVGGGGDEDDSRAVTPVAAEPPFVSAKKGLPAFEITGPDGRSMDEEESTAAGSELGAGRDEAVARDILGIEGQPDWANLLNDDGQIDLALFAPASAGGGGGGSGHRSSNPSPGRSPMDSEAATPRSSPMTTPVPGTPLSSAVNSPRASPPVSPGSSRKRSASVSTERRPPGPVSHHTGGGPPPAGGPRTTSLRSRVSTGLLRRSPGGGSNDALNNSLDGRPGQRRRSTMAGGGDGRGAAAASSGSLSPRPARAKDPLPASRGRQPVFCDCPPNPALPPEVDLRLLTAHQLLEYPLELARQMTLIEHEYFKDITAAECLEKVRAGSGSTKPRPALGGDMGVGGHEEGGAKPGDPAAETAVARFIHRFNVVSAWVAGLIVSEPDLEKRTWLMTQLLRAAVRCKALNNFNGVMEITSALGTAAVRRLTDTWDSLSLESRATYEKLTAFAHAEGNFKAYRLALEEAKTPAVPYFGMNLRDLTFLHHGNPDFVKNGLINIYKARAMSALLQSMKRLQQGSYKVLIVPEIRSFLMNIQPLGDDELFRRSQMVQPPVTRRSSGHSRSSLHIPMGGGVSNSGSATAGAFSGASDGAGEAPATPTRSGRLTRRSSSTNLGFLRMGPLKEGKAQ